MKTSEIPPTGVTAVGGWFRSRLQRNGLRNFENPTNRSWWIVQIQPIRPHRRAHETELAFRMHSAALCPRRDLNNLPTSVGGISDFSPSLISPMTSARSKPVNRDPRTHGMRTKFWIYFV